MPPAPPTATNNTTWGDDPFQPEEVVLQEYFARFINLQRDYVTEAEGADGTIQTDPERSEQESVATAAVKDDYRLQKVKLLKRLNY